MVRARGAAPRRSPRSKRPASSPARSIRRNRRSTSRISATPASSPSANFPASTATLPLAPTPIELSETPGTYRRRAPLLGEHTDQILRSLGYGAAEIAALREERVI